MAHPRISSSFFPNQGDGFQLGNGKVAMLGFMANIKVNFNLSCASCRMIHAIYRRYFPEIKEINNLKGERSGLLRPSMCKPNVIFLACERKIEGSRSCLNDSTMRACADDFRFMKESLRQDLDLIGMDVADQPSKVPCRILQAPRLRYKSRTAEIRDGQW